MNARQESTLYALLYRRQSIESRNIAPAKENIASSSKFSDGTSIYSDANDRIVYVEYPTGMKVRRNKNSVVVAMPDGNYWYSTGGNRWHILD